MKVKLLSTLLALTFLWACIVSYQFLKITNNPRVIAVTTDVGKGAFQNMQVGELERLTFLRQFLDRYYNYDSNNFWQSQTSLASLMGAKLGESRVREVGRLREKIQQKNLSHLSQILQLKKQPDGSYKATTHLQISEASNKDSEPTKSQLFIVTRLKLQDTERTLENPWGLLVSEMAIEKTSPAIVPFQKKIHVKNDTPTLLMFPCAIENIVNPQEKNLKIKITTLNVSELQLTPQMGLKEKTELSATCRDIEYKFTIVHNEAEQDLFVAIPKEAGIKKVLSAKPRKKDVYDKTIENVLGIQLDQ